MRSLKINSIDIHGIGPILGLHLEFDPHFNIICGANGVGKTTILDCVAQTFAAQNLSVRCNAKKDEGDWSLHFEVDGEKCEESRSTAVKYLNSKFNSGKWSNHNDSLVVFRVNRSMSYVEVKSVERDPTFERWQTDQLVAEGVKYEEIKGWFVHRFMWSAHAGLLNDVEIGNFAKAKECFRTINSDFAFKEVCPETNDILISTSLGAIELEQMSSGYIAMLIVLLGIIKEIEYRFKDPQTKKPVVKVDDFTGVVILDEMDVHLHPAMQARMYVALKTLLPKAQVITSTHSPHVIQIAKPNEIIPLVKDGENIKKNPLGNSECGCQGWTVEEILKDVMNMSETRTSEYRQALEDFNVGVSEDDGAKVNVAYAKLDKMLHPNNVLRQVLEIKKIGVGNDQD